MDALGRAPGHVVAVEDRLPIVTEWSGMKDFVNCPPDYETWARQYYHTTRHYLSKFGIHPRYFDDIVQEIMQRFQERDSLGVFSRDWKTRSTTGKSNFRSYYIRFIVEYAPGKKRNYVKRSARELLIADAPAYESEEGSDSPTFLDDYVARVAPTPEPESGAAFSELVASLRTAVDPALTDVLDALILAALAGSELDPADLAASLGCTRPAARAQLDSLRSGLASALR